MQTRVAPDQFRWFVDGTLGARKARSISDPRSISRSTPASRTQNRLGPRRNLDLCYPGLNLTRMPARAALEPAPTSRAAGSQPMRSQGSSGRACARLPLARVGM
jgi:hypothetical protein